MGWIIVGWLAVAGLVQAAMYKWVDDNGVTQYSQFPPPGRQAENLSPQRAPRPTGQNAPAAEQPAQDAAPQAPPGQQAAPDPAKAKAEAERRTKNCGIARANLEKLTTGGRLRLMGDDGVAYYPTEEERQARIAEAREQIDKFCD